MSDEYGIVEVQVVEITEAVATSQRYVPVNSKTPHPSPGNPRAFDSR